MNTNIINSVSNVIRSSLGRNVSTKELNVICVKHAKTADLDDKLRGRLLRTFATTNDQSKKSKINDKYKEINAEYEGIKSKAVELRPFVYLAKAPYTGSLPKSEDMETWATDSAYLQSQGKNTPRQLALDICSSIKSMHLGNDGKLICSKSGLTAFIAINEKSKQIVISFGGTTSGEKNSSKLGNRAIANLGYINKQNMANAINGIGRHTPKSYSQAATLAANLKRLAPKGYKVIAVGHSKGAAEAEYAALSNGIRAYCFASAALSDHNYEKAMKKHYGDNWQLSQEDASEKIEHCFVKGDIIPKLGFGKHYGKITYIPSFDGVKPIAHHDKFDKYILAASESTKAF
ncbi:lipase family protein [Vibrio pectenicida]|uniref:Lipase family protein n=1 Tax=Vibrio pectenicida TaxID=62763 RepID=A0A7Y4EEY0_9VIBR|nr:hypothetical protein [Vibrio pectenicida]NOH71838.1 lipase family protein [Vibrio pectenicida]